MVHEDRSHILIEKACAGDREAFGALVEGIRPRLVALANPFISALEVERKE